MSYKMISEIREQPEILRKLAEDKNQAPILRAAAAIKRCEAHKGHVYLVGNGSSYHACIYGQFILSVRSRLVINLHDTSEFSNFIANLKAKDVVIMVSQSGETGDAIKIMPKVKDKKSKIIAVTNYPDSTLGKKANIVVPMRAGECEAIPNTKGYTATMAIFALIAEKVRGDEDFSKHVKGIASDIERIIVGEYDRLQALADKLSQSKNLFVLGHASGLSNAYEAALKIKECSHIEAEGYSALEFRHGPSSVVTIGTPVIVFMADYESEEDLGRILEEISAPDPFVVGIGSTEHTQFDERFEAYEHNLYASIAAIVPMQILAFELALSRGINPDKPSGVKKIVESI